MIVSARVQ